MDLNKIDRLCQQVIDYLEVILEKGTKEVVQTF